MEKSHQPYKKKEITPVVDNSLEGIEQKLEFDIQRQSIERELGEKYNETMVKLFKRLSYELAVIGLPLEDACLIVGLDYEKVQHLINTDETVSRLIKLKDLEYKRGLLEVVSIKSKGDEKMSMWMLERRYPSEFNPKKGQGPNGEEGDNIVKQAITFIQVNGYNAPLVSRAARVSERLSDNDGESKGIKKRILDILR